MKPKTLLGNKITIEKIGVWGLEWEFQKQAKPYYNKIKNKDCVVAYYDYGMGNEVMVTKIKNKVVFWFSYNYYYEDTKENEKRVFILDNHRSNTILDMWLRYEIEGYKSKAKVEIFDYKAFESLKNSHIQEKI